MKSMLLRRLTALLVAGLLAIAPAALAEGFAPVEAAEEMPEAPIEEVIVELGDAAEVVDPEIAEAEAVDEISAQDAALAGADSGIPIDEEHFPDEHFRQYIADIADHGNPYSADGKDGVLSKQEIEGVTELYLHETLGVQSLAGIEYLTALEILYCPNLGLSELDVSGNARLLELDCFGNRLTELDVSGNPKLLCLRCEDNALTELDVSDNPKLIDLYCDRNRLTELDVSGNARLSTLFCSLNRLTALDISDNPALRALNCFDNRLTELDVRENPALELLWCGGNKLTALDVRENARLYDLSCERSKLVFLDVTYCPALVKLLKAEDSFPSGTRHFTYTYEEGNRTCSLCVDSNVALITDPMDVVALTGSKSMKVKVGSVFRIEPGVRFLSSRTKVATVSTGGVVKARAAGKAVITVTLSSGKTRKLKLTVEKPASPKVKGLTLDQSGTISVDVNDGIRLTCALDPQWAQSEVVWKSSSVKIAEVDENGVVTPLKTGKVTITATAVNGKTSKSAKVKLNIRNLHAPRSIAIAQGKSIAIREGSSRMLIATLVGRTGYAPHYSVFWKSSKPKVVSVDWQGVITAHEPGTAKITAIASGGKKAVITVKVTQ